LENGRRGLVRAGAVYDVTTIVDEVLGAGEPEPGDPFIAHLNTIAARVAAATDLGPALCAVNEARFLSPVEAPTKIVAAPVNYQLHIQEAEADSEIHRGRAIDRIETAGLFLKAPTSLVGPAEGIALRFPDRRNDHELEVGVVIGCRCANIRVEQALDAIAGYAIAIDVTVRGTEDRSFRKSIDSYSVLGPYLISPDEISDPTALEFSLSVNGQLRQSSNTKHMVKDIATLIAWASEWYTLYPGDVLMTGTPEGVGPLVEGDRIDCTFSGGATMHVPVRSAEVPARSTRSA
jgi:2-keto-4-pentenoate hydratase/2-oxohepta-3-ene-1,7-dioic acid hydratase in catechol pathway